MADPVCAVEDSGIPNRLRAARDDSKHFFGEIIIKLIELAVLCRYFNYIFLRSKDLPDDDNHYAPKNLGSPRTKILTR